MRGDQVNKWLLGVGIWILLFSCQKLEDDHWGITQQGTLAIETRSAENDTLPYPLYLYAFSSSGKCVGTQTVERKDEAMQLELPSGDYRLVAAAGCSDGYVMPAVRDCEDQITLSSDASPATPLLMGMGDVTLVSEAVNKLEIVLSYSVTALDVALSGIPSEVVGVGVKVSPFYASMNLKGEYRTPDTSLELACSLDTAGRWVSPTLYAFPGSGEETVFSITFTLKDGTKSSYGYVWKNTPKANQPYHLKGNYAGSLRLEGTLGITGWEESEVVDFEFGSKVQPEGGNDDSDTGQSAMPEVGSKWNDTWIVDVGETDATGAEVLLMSSSEWAALASEADGVAAVYQVNGISGWRFPTYEEAQRLKDAFGGNAGAALGLKTDERYLCKKEGVYYSFSFADRTKFVEAGEKKTYYIRLVKSYRIER